MDEKAATTPAKPKEEAATETDEAGDKIVVESKTTTEKANAEKPAATEKTKTTAAAATEGAAAVTTPETKKTKTDAVEKWPAAATAATASPPPRGDDERSKRVYVGNLAWEVSWQDLKDHMKTTGLDVVRTNIMQTPDGRSKGCGIAEFSTFEDAQQAVLDLNDTELHGRQIFVREDREDRNTSSAAAATAAGGGVAAAGGAAYAGRASAGAPPGGGGGGHRFSVGESAKTRRVYVGNLSWDVAWQDLKDHMRQAGEVIHAEVITEYNGRSKGCGIVEYSSEEEAQEAITTLTDTELKGRMIFVREDRETSSQGGHPTPPSRGQNTSVYVWNLAPETSWQDLKDHMRKAGNVDSATILTNTQGESVGCGVVVYQRPQEALRAIRELQNSELNGRPMFAREDREAGRGGPGRGFAGGRGRGAAPGGRGRGRGGGGRGGGGRFGSTSAEGTNLYVGNLADETTWKELKDHFRQCGDVRRAEVAQGKGFGTIQFFHKEDADAAISRLNGSELQGSTLEVRLDQKSPR